MKNIITDTNVWYDIGNGNIEILNHLKKIGKLCATPLNILEIASKVNKENFTIRKNAAQAILAHADRFLHSNEEYLARYWGVKLNAQVQWREGAKTLSKASSPQELMNGYIDVLENVRRKHDTTLLKYWRTYQYKDFENSVIKAIEHIHPTYIKKASIPREFRRLNDPELIALFDSDEMKNSGILSTYERVKLIFKVDNLKNALRDKPSSKMFKNAKPKVEIYINAYNQYLKHLATQKAAPDENDLGDHEAFMYLQNKNWCLATSDKRWIHIANIVCPNQLINLLQYKN